MYRGQSPNARWLREWEKLKQKHELVTFGNLSSIGSWNKIQTHLFESLNQFSQTSKCDFTLIMPSNTIGS